MWARMQYCECSSHSGEFLSLVCLHPACQGNRLICSLCRDQAHGSHSFLPYKQFLVSSQAALDREDHLRCGQLFQQMEQQFAGYHDRLGAWVRKTAESVQLLQKSLLKGIADAKLALLAKLKSNRELGKELLGVQNDRDIQRHKRLVESLLQNSRISGSHISVNSLEVPRSNLLNALESGFRPLEEGFAGLQGLLQGLSQKIEKTSYSDLVMEYKFSSSLRGESISIEEGGVRAKQLNKGQTGGRIALLDPCIDQGLRSLQFRVHSLTSWVGVGVCVSSLVAKVGYRFESKELGHGCYMLSNNGYIWSNCSTSENSLQRKNMAFVKGDVVRVTACAGEGWVQFQVRRTGQRVRCQLVPSEVGELHFAVNLMSANDSVEVLRPQ